MLALAKKHRVILGLAVVALAYYLWTRSKKTTTTKVAATGNVLDPSNDAALSKLFDQMNPTVKTS